MEKNPISTFFRLKKFLSEIEMEIGEAILGSTEKEGEMHNDDNDKDNGGKKSSRPKQRLFIPASVLHTFIALGAVSSVTLVQCI